MAATSAVFYDPGSNGTEAIHTRRVVSAVEQLAADSRYGGITIRRIFNDAIADDFGLPPPEDNKTRAQLGAAQRPRLDAGVRNPRLERVAP